MEQQCWQCACGANNRLEAEGCSRCGSPAPVAPCATAEPMVYGQPLSQAPAVVCRACGCLDGQKVSAICQAGSWTSQGSGVSVGVGHVFGGPNFATVGRTHSASISATQLAQVLAPPPMPPVVGSANFFLTALLALPLLLCGAGTAFLLLLAVAASLFWVPFLIALGVTVAFGCMFYGVARGEHALFEERRRSGLEHRARWEQAMHNWESLYYCPRCDSVYDPVTLRTARAHETSSLL